MKLQPTGDVAFLFTDIEGSSRLWEQFPELMPDVIARHDVLMQGAVDAHGGYTFKTVGDAFCVAFSRPSRAVAAAVDAQLSLAAEDWPGTSDEFPGLTARMGVHCGFAHAIEGDYIGRAVNRAARVMSAGHGGQILLSQVARELADGNLPPQCSTRDLGVHALRDLAEPEEIHQLLHENLRSEFPSLKTLEELPNNLPTSLSSFVGRDSELTEVGELLSRARLVTLTGPGGCGKTRLALQVAADALADFKHGVWLADMSALDDPTLVAATVAAALGLHDVAGRATDDHIADHLRHRNALLVLDNCEHLVDECASLAYRILSSCGDVRILATSQQTLGVSGEHIWQVSTLSSPEASDGTSLDDLKSFEAVQLFDERARARRPDFEISGDNAPAVVRICRRLEGTPMAIELAAARIRVLSAEQIDHRLEDSLLSLGGGVRTLKERHESLRKAIDWSYGLLDADEKALFSRLSVFAGGFSLDKAEAVCGNQDAGHEHSPAVLDLLEDLVDKSLATTYRGTGHGLRYRLPEALRQYAREQLLDAGDSELISLRHAEAFRVFAVEASQALTTSDQKAWLDSMETELDNLRRALGWFIATGAATSAQHLGASMWRFWAMRGHLNEGTDWLERALAINDVDTDISTRARAHNAAGCLHFYIGDYPTAQRQFEENLALSRQSETKQGVVDALNNLATVAMERGQFDAALLRYEECLPLQLELGDDERISSIYYNIGTLRHARGELDDAAQLFEHCLEHAVRAGDVQARADALIVIGDLELSHGRYDAAASLHEEGLALYREIEDSIGCADALVDLGAVYYYTGDYARAREVLAEGVGIAMEVDDMEIITEGLDILGEIDRRQGLIDDARRNLRDSMERRRAADANRKLIWSLERYVRLADAIGNSRGVCRLSGAVTTQRRSAGMSPRAVRVADREELAACLVSAQSALGADAAATEHDDGAEMTLDEALDYAVANV